jgi:GDP-L-fucose synthase
MKKKSVYLSGHSGMVGHSILNFLNKKRYKIIIPKNKLNLTNITKTEYFFKTYKPDIVINLAGKVGGIQSNANEKIEYLNVNTLIQLNIINCCWKYKVKKLINIGSNCIYPKKVKNKIFEHNLMDGKLEETNEGYSLAKILGLKLCQFYNEKYKTEFLTIMPANLYGPFDNFYDDNSHVVPALIRKIYRAKRLGLKKVSIWGSGKPIRDFLYVDELSRAIIFFLDKSLKSLIHNQNIHHINIGSGKGISILALAKKIKKIINYKGSILCNEKIKDGHKKKVLDISLSKKIGFKTQENFDKNLKSTIEWYLLNIKNF